MDLVIGIILYAVPLLALPFVARDAVCRRAAISAMFVAPLVGEIFYLIWLSGDGVAAVGATRFWAAVVAYYPMAVLPFGFWAAVIAAIAARYRLRIPNLTRRWSGPA